MKIRRNIRNRIRKEIRKYYKLVVKYFKLIVDLKNQNMLAGYFGLEKRKNPNNDS